MKNQKGVSLITLIITIIVVIILAIIILRSGVSNTPDQAAFSGFTKDMGELQDNMKLAMLSAKGDEAIRGNNRSEAQLYNFVARGGYTVMPATPSGDAKWLIQADAETIPCTLINKEFAEESLGMDLPVITVETAKGTNQEVSFFVTAGGTVFCWPPYLYDGKSYVTADYALNSGDVTATAAATATLQLGKELVIVSNGTTSLDQEKFTRNLGANTAADEDANWSTTPSVWYPSDVRQADLPKWRGVASGFVFELMQASGDADHKLYYMNNF